MERNRKIEYRQMFVLSRMVDTVRIAPNDFNKDFQGALIFALNKKFANKVVLNVGLCVCFYDFEKIEDSYILPGDGASHTKVHFRYVVFHPFVDEILTGKIRSCDQSGINISMGFFDDIIIPRDKLPHPSRFQERDQLWIWDYETAEEGSAAVELFLEPGSDVRFRIAEERFTETQPCTIPPEAGDPLDESEKRQVPYLILGSMGEPGLGCLHWWTN